MLLAPRHGFVFLAMTKAGSTSIENAFRPYAQLTQRRSPGIKHTKYAGFQRYLQPYLASQGFPRRSYEVVCVMREPIDWLSSWWRYRARDELADPSHPKHCNYTGHVTFEEFAREFMRGEAEYVQVGRPAQFVQPLPGEAPMDRIFRYDQMDSLVDYLCEKVGRKVEVGVKNVSPKMNHALSEECETELRGFFEPEYQIYEQIEAEPVGNPRSGV